MEQTFSPPLTSDSLASWLKSQPLETRTRLLGRLSKVDQRALAFKWRGFWARPSQLAPPGDWHVWLIKAGRGFGKALELDTPIPTPEGWTTMGDLAVGDRVFDERGEVCRVTFATPVQHGRTCYRVVFSDGEAVVADKDHLWLTSDKATRKAQGRAKAPRSAPLVRATEEIRQSLWVGREVNHSVAVAAPLNLPPAELPVPPYTLGVWLGDGSSACADLTVGDADRDEMTRLLGLDGTSVSPKARRKPGSDAVTFSIGGCASVRGGDGRMRANGSMHSRLKQLGLLNHKHIPKTYLRGSEEQRLALLQGLMDTDGSVTPRGHVEFCSCNHALGHGVYELAVSLGFKPTLKVGRATLDGRVVGDRYRVTFTPHRPVFRLTRKVARQHTGKAQASRVARRYIVDVQPVPTVAVRCIQVDSPSHLFLCGRGMIPTHNTRTGAEWVREQIESERCKRIAIVNDTAADVRDVNVEGPAGLLAVCPPWNKPVYEPSKRRVTWPNGAVAICYAAEAPELLRGPEHDGAWPDEPAKWKNLRKRDIEGGTAWDNLMMGLRVGTPRCVVTTTPRNIPWMRKLIERQGLVLTGGSSYENRSNLSPVWFEQVLSQYEGTRLGRQEIHAHLIEDVDGALWQRAQIDADRVHQTPDLRRIVVAIDPAGVNRPQNSETGIVAAGVAGHGGTSHGYVMADKSGHYSPEGWATAAVQLYRKEQADRIVAEVNHGGDMVAHTIRTVDPNVPVKVVHASRGKKSRAEPVAALYEQHRVHHVGGLPELEDQQCTWNPDADDISPDRVDAAVWALTELMVESAGGLSIGRVTGW